MAGLVFLEVCGNASGALALLIGLRPGDAGGLGDGGDLFGVADQIDRFFGGWIGRRGFGRRFDSLAAGFLECVQTALGLVGFAAEADGAAPEAENAGQWFVIGAGLAECLQRVEAEADDLGGEA